MSDHAFSLVTPFLTDDPMFAAGVEFGMLYCELRSGKEVVHGYYQRENQDRILLAASRLGYRVVKMRTFDEDWFLLRLRRTT